MGMDYGIILNDPEPIFARIDKELKLEEIQKEEKIKGKMLFMPSRIMITGEMHGPDLTLIMDVLGKDEVLNRIKSVASIMQL